MTTKINSPTSDTMHTSGVRSLLFYVAVLLFLIHPAGRVSAIAPTSITGNVYSSYTGGPVQGAMVYTSLGLSTEASASGTYFLNVPPGNYDLIVTAPGYRSNILTGITIAAGSTVRFDFRLFPSGISSGTLSGQVVQSGDTLQEPEGIADAFIASNLGAYTFTDTDGYFSLFTSTGTAALTIAAAGFASRTIEPFNWNAQAPVGLTVALDPLVTGKVRINGSVRDACTGFIVSDARVVSPTAGERLNPSGTFSLLTYNGSNTLYASAPGYQCRYLSFQPEEGTPLPQDVDIELVPSDNGSVFYHGTVFDAVSFDTISNVMCESATGEASYSLEDGTYKLYVSGCATSLTYLKAGYETASVDIIPALTDTGALDVYLQPLSSIYGTVTASNDGHPLCCAFVSIDSAGTVTAATKADGSYELTSISPGTYSVIAEHNCYQPDNATAIVERGDRIQLDFSLDPYSTGVLQGTVTSRFTGRPVANALITADHGAVTSTDDKGFYRYELPSCETFITVTADGFISEQNIGVNISQDVHTLDVSLVPCPVTVILDEAAPSTRRAVRAVFRHYRDEVRKRNDLFNTYTLRYYRHASEILDVLMHDFRMRKRLYQVLLETHAIIIRSDFSRPPAVSCQYADSLAAFLIDFSCLTDSEGLKNTTDALLSDIAQEKFFTITPSR